ncbi:BACON domain-containing carbohydrate-binding protein [Bacteroides sp.]|uniref:BACON domain-containing protein n=1 Tax=Bacteroides sp. TaxID=29523 RepID=UPI001B5EDE38|nr:BACON domain-containing carbohydrate-binding protein [Bacteroides sp.]MBP6064607.1 hypothetical protein [Bacteroides sp.]MBP6066948.1 hypothetical protein [Bacteroides sp.]MBP6935832.1 hypothetical protein [Bacteroides sp.]MBP8622252.1 hypothetical protein [Bacteroides sp.]MBP9506819.1 hypothetical protein [Bacteroides sp.]
MVRNRMIKSGKWNRLASFSLFLCLSLWLCLAGCQDFTDETGGAIPEPDLKFTNETMKLSLDKQIHSIELESNLPWRVKTSATWVELLATNGMGTGSFQVAVTKNTEVTSREAEITGWIVEGKETKMKVVQEGIGIALKKRTVKVGAKGSVAEVVPFATVVEYTCALSEGCDWIQVTECPTIDPNVINNLELKLSIDPYTDTEDGRTGYVYLKGANNITDTLMVVQDKKPLEDIDYLRMFYEGANGENWVKKWNLNAALVTNATQWPGVTFTNGRVTAIDFYTVTKNGVEGDITPLCYLSELTALKFRHQKITAIPEKIGLLTQLIDLWVVESATGGNLPESLGNCKLLRTLNISNHPTATPAGFENTFSGNLDMLINIPSIVTIKAYCNQLSGSLPVLPLDESNKPTTWNNLKEFMVYSNGFSGTIPQGYGTVIDKSGTTGIFRVENNQLSGQIPTDLKAWSEYIKRKAAWILQGNSLTE